MAPKPCATLPGDTERRSTQTIQDNPNWHRHRNACPQYRERWTVDDEAGDEGCALLYQIICLQNTPPERPEEQDLCMRTRKVCWRLAGKAAPTGDGEANPATAVPPEQANATEARV